MNKRKVLNKIRERRERRVRAKISGTAEKPRISVFKSNRDIFIQAIDDTLGKTITSSSLRLIEKKHSLKKEQALEKLAETIANDLKSRQIEKAVFDRGRYKFHGVIKKIAENLRKNGIKI
ncbi:MAG: 50S ribosomal protein L18 [Candidatus Parcubacteria bacterium]|nr:50S ribosomal protein L18 [Patescibacteria group bacterium]BCX16148.1 MAG: 50S ribosomal protein L18 [Candidatus Parcubacteria bacterium]